MAVWKRVRTARMSAFFMGTSLSSMVARTRVWGGTRHSDDFSVAQAVRSAAPLFLTGVPIGGPVEDGAVEQRLDRVHLQREDSAFEDDAGELEHFDGAAVRVDLVVRADVDVVPLVVLVGVRGRVTTKRHKQPSRYWVRRPQSTQNGTDRTTPVGTPPTTIPNTNAPSDDTKHLGHQPATRTCSRNTSRAVRGGISVNQPDTKRCSRNADTPTGSTPGRGRRRTCHGGLAGRCRRGGRRQPPGCLG